MTNEQLSMSRGKGVTRRLSWIAMGMLAILLVLPGAMLAGCDESQDDGTKPQTVEDLPALELTDATDDLLLTWIDDKGGTHTEVAIADVPEAGRELVRVIVTDEQAGQGSRFYVANLKRKGADGSYELRTMTRLEWENIIEKRRKAYLAKVAPRPPPTARASGTRARPPSSAAPSGSVVATVYGADWCGPCHQAQAYLKKRGVKVTYKDIDKSSAARREMQRKLRRAGKGGASIPVIDVGGQLLQGFSPRALDAAIKRARRGTAL